MDFIVQHFSYIIQIYKVYDVNKKFIESSINFNMIILKKKTKKFKMFFKEFLKRKNKHILIRKFNITLNEKNYDHPTFFFKKKLISIYFLFTVWKKIT